MHRARGQSPVRISPDTGRTCGSFGFKWDRSPKAPETAAKTTFVTQGDWSERRERAQGLLRERLPNGAPGGRRPPGAAGAPPDSAWHFRDGSELVRVFLWEGDDEAALGAAREHECSVDLWRAIAERREAEHPEVAIPAYQRTVQHELARKSKESYAEAVELLGKIRRLMKRIGNVAAFDEYLESVVAQHRRKRNFMKLLAAADMIAGM